MTTVEEIYAKLGITADESLEHSGVKGMRWGKRKQAKADAAAKKHAVRNMSDDELKSAINRIKLEREYATLTAPQLSSGRKAVNQILANVAKQQSQTYLNKAISSQIDNQFAIMTNGKGRHRA